MEANRFSVMVVDDARENLRLLEIMLGRDHDVHSYHSGEACLEAVKAKAPDLILLDVFMPEMDGYEVCRALKSMPETHHIPVIFLSAATSAEEKVAGYEAGGEDYVTRPFDIETLMESIHSCLAEREEELQLQARAEEAQAIAQEAMVSSSELGILNNFSRRCGHANSYQALAACLFEACRDLGLNCSAAFFVSGKSHFFGCSKGGIEANLLEKFQGTSRFLDFNARTLVNGENCSILVKNMPVGDLMRYGRLKDHLATIIEATETRLISLGLMLNAEAQRAEAIQSLIENNDAQLQQLLVDLELRDSQRASIMKNMLTEVEEQLQVLGLDDDQEQYLIRLLDERIQQMDALPDIGSDVAESFNTSRETLNQLLNQQLVEPGSSSNSSEASRTQK